jgi:glycolate oxidase iron-sulfur subunit
MENAVEVTQFFGSRLPELMSGKGQKRQALRVAYHDPCHSSYHLKVKHEPRQLLTALGFDPLATERGCCGFGGTFRLLYQGLSESMLEKRADVYGGADMIVTSCPNCILQLKSRIKDRKIQHIVEVIDEVFMGERQ